MGAVCTSERAPGDVLDPTQSDLQGSLDYLGNFWKGTWKYKARNEDHFFSVMKRGEEYVYKEVIGNHEVRAPGIVDVHGNITISSSTHNFQILLERHSTCARFRGAGNKWGKPIPILRCGDASDIPIRATRSNADSVSTMPSYSRKWRPPSSSLEKTTRLNNTSMISNYSRPANSPIRSVSSSTESFLSVPSGRLSPHVARINRNQKNRSSSKDSNAV